MIDVPTLEGDGGFKAYLAEPAGAPRGAIVVIQEIFGVNEGIRRKCDHWAGLGYLALGDWHGMRQVAARCWYSGTPEVDDFDVVDCGFALLEEARDPGAAPEITPLATGR